MTERRARLVVRSLAFLLPVLLAAAIGLTLGDATASFEDLPFIVLFAVGLTSFATIGLVIAAKAPTNPIGWLYAAAGLGLLTSVTLNEFAIRAATDLDLPGAGYVQFASDLFGYAAILALVLAILLFPTGNLASPRWRVVLWAIGVGLVAGLASSFALKTFEVAPDLLVPNPLHISGIVTWDWLGAVSAVASVAAALGAAVSIGVRYLRARDEERQQIRWLAFAVGLVVVMVALLFVSGGSAVGDAVFLATTASILVGLPAATAVAVLRYRLYDLDLVIKKTVVFAITAALLMVVGVGGLLAASSPLTDLVPDETLAVGLVGLAIGALIWPLWRLSRRFADRLVFGGRASPYEALTVFSGRLSETYATDDVLSRMAALVGEVTRAVQTRVWIVVGGEFHPAACWPSETSDPPPVDAAQGLAALPDAHHASEIRDRGDLLGALTASFPANDPIGPGRRAMIDDLAGQAGPVLQNVRLIEELRASRRRIVSAQDARAKRLERNIHDGAQQQLVALAVKLRLAAQTVERDPAAARRILAGLQDDANDALETLRDLARGIYPPLLADKGLPAALEAQARKASIPAHVRAEGIGRYAPEVEATVYFCSLEAMANAAKYADASTLILELAQLDGSLRFSVTDDGRGFDPSSNAPGTGLQGMADRVDAIGGTFDVASRPGQGTTVTGVLPVSAPGRPEGPPSGGPA